jgi:hypothetical protein
VVAATTPMNFWVTRAGEINKRAVEKGVVGLVTPDELSEIYLSQQGRCHWCSVEMRVGRANTKAQKPKVMTFDHVWPLSRGGSNTASNLVAACRGCNHGRDARWWVAFHACSA